MLDDSELMGQQIVTARFQEHLVLLERLALTQGMELVAHLLGCARMAMEQDAGSATPPAPGLH